MAKYQFVADLREVAGGGRRRVGEVGEDKLTTDALFQTTGAQSLPGPGAEVTPRLTPLPCPTPKLVPHHEPLTDPVHSGVAVAATIGGFFIFDLMLFSRQPLSLRVLSPGLALSFELITYPHSL